MFVDYKIARPGQEVGPVTGLYDYVWGGNGIFLRAERPGIRVVMPTQAGVTRGLDPVKPICELDPLRGLIPAGLLAAIWKRALEVAPNEVLFCLDGAGGRTWELWEPDQIAANSRVRAADCYDRRVAESLVEIHSHHYMAPTFSRDCDDVDEHRFKVYGVIGNLRSAPAIRFRVGIAGYLWPVPASWVSELPEGLSDAAGG